MKISELESRVSAHFRDRLIARQDLLLHEGDIEQAVGALRISFWGDHFSTQLDEVSFEPQLLNQVREEADRALEEVLQKT